ncbi:MAG: DEAD/DEAH box helicase [Armatimonadetes bacterium]|nr:DEAD/DEAH box helicase [Armatimonadota bacterium]
MTQFAELGLCEPLLRAISDAGYLEPTPIQSESIPHLLAGNDLLGCAQTGTGKTAAFALPILQRLAAEPRDPGLRGCRALILSPTRELAMQIDECLTAYGYHLGISHAVVYGGVHQNPQVQALAKGVDVLVATPGRLLDLMNQGYCRLWKVEVLVLDEADRMLDMGFIHDVREILAAVPRNRQGMMFSATVPPRIRHLAGEILNDPAEVMVAPSATPVEQVDQRVMFVDRADKRALLCDMVRDLELERVLVFTRTKHGASRLASQIVRYGGLSCDSIHGDKLQSSRDAALRSFKEGRIRVLVATDVAARGLDIDDIGYVVNYDLPNDPDSYVHRIGRTARAGAEGVAVTFCDVDEIGSLRDIERQIDTHLPIVTDQPYHSEAGREKALRMREAPPSRGQSGRGRSRGGRQRSRGRGRSNAMAGD